MQSEEADTAVTAETILVTEAKIKAALEILETRFDAVEAELNAIKVVVNKLVRKQLSDNASTMQEYELARAERAADMQTRFNFCDEAEKA